MRQDSDNHDGRGTKYSFPCTVTQTQEMLRSEKRSERLIKTMHDDWEKFGFDTRHSAVVDIVENICWYAGADVEKVKTILKDKPLYENWSGEEFELEMLVVAQRYKIQDGTHYGNFD